MSGYFEIGIYQPKYEENIGTLMRSAYQLGATGVFTVGKRYSRQAGDIFNIAKHVPLRHYADMPELMSARPDGAQLIGVEKGGEAISGFAHPKRAIYLLGAEDYGLPPEIAAQCDALVTLDAVREPMYNVAVAGSIVMYDRMCMTKTITP